MNEAKRTEMYEKLPENIRPIYSSPAAAALNRQIIEKYSILKDSEDMFLETTGDVILGFYKTSELPELLQKEVGVSADDAQKIVSDLDEFLAPVIAREKAEANQNKAELQELQQTFSSKPVTEQVPNPVPSSQTEAPTPVQPMRTMEGDMSRIHGYGAYRAQFPDEPKEAEHTQEVIRSASQEDLLKEKPKLAEMPTYEENE
jgi:hypothetical protein